MIHWDMKKGDIQVNEPENLEPPGHQILHTILWKRTRDSLLLKDLTEAVASQDAECPLQGLLCLPSLPQELANMY